MKWLITLSLVCIMVAPAYAQSDSLQYGSMSGHVYDDSTMAPILGAHVVAYGNSSGDAYTDSAGYYQIVGLLPGQYFVEASASGYSPATRDSVAVNEGQNTPNVDFWLESYGAPQHGSMSGHVYEDSSGIPIPGAHVVAYGNGSGDAYTDSTGYYEIDSLVEGIYFVEASASGYWPATKDSVVVNEGQNTPDVDFWLEPYGGPQYGSMSGHVYDDSTMAPILGAHVVAQGQSWGDAYTDSTGYYCIVDLLPGGYFVEASASGYEPAMLDSIPVYAGQNTPDVTFYLTPYTDSLTGIAGCVTNSYTNDPIMNALVTAINPYGSYEANTNYYGEYFIECPEGYYIVKASAVGFLPATYPDSVVVNEGHITNDVDFALEPTDTVDYGGIIGTILDAVSGLSIPYAQVYASGANGQGQDYANSSGMYLISVASGQYTVRAAAAGYYPATYPSSVTVDSGQYTTDIDITLWPTDTCGLAGFIGDGETGLMIPGADITATGPSGTVQVETNVQGDYLFDNLEDGVYHLHIEANGYQSVDYPDAILVSNGLIKSFVCPPLYPETAVEEGSQFSSEKINLVCYPNPFRDKTEIVFSANLPAKNMELQVYDAAGRCVRTFRPESSSRGSVRITWDGTDDHGDALPKGVYFYELKIDNARVTKKVILLQ
jgi:hypothetical protein